MSSAKRKELSGTGRGAVGKTAVVGAKDRETGQVTAKVVQSTDKPTLEGFIRENVQAGAQLYTDEAKACTGMDDYAHEAVSHSVSLYGHEMAHTNGVESFWAILKRGYHGTFHHLSPQHLHRYVAEFAGRHNDRCSDTIDIMRQMALGMDGRRPPFKALVGKTC
ncbi:MAG: IS1595 family transposase [Albidovulum sp.]|nr:IS1595 family transposase [Albidovulum sp.]